MTYPFHKSRTERVRATLTVTLGKSCIERVTITNHFYIFSICLPADALSVGPILWTV